MKSKIEIVSYEKHKVIKVYRVCFRKIKPQGIRRFVKNAFFDKKKLSQFE